MHNPYRILANKEYNLSPKVKTNDPGHDADQFAFESKVKESSAESSVPPSNKTDAKDSKAAPPRHNTSGSSRKADRQEIFLPVSGFVWLHPEEISVVNHPAFQRLGRIYQLGQSYVVFRGATHKRLEPTN